MHCAFCMAAVCCVPCMGGAQMNLEPAYTVLTRYYAPFVYKPPLPFCMNSLGRYIYLQFKPPLTTEELCNSDEREVG